MVLGTEFVLIFKVRSWCCSRMSVTLHSGASNSLWREGHKKIPKDPPFAYVFLEKNFKKKLSKGGGGVLAFSPPRFDGGGGAWLPAPPPAVRCATVSTFDSFSTKRLKSRTVHQLDFITSQQWQEESFWLIFLLGFLKTPEKNFIFFFDNFFLFLQWPRSFESNSNHIQRKHFDIFSHEKPLYSWGQNT